MCDPRDLGQTIGDDGDNADTARIAGSGEAQGAPPAPAREPAPADGSHLPRRGFDPTIFLFDNVPGGVGLAERIYHSSTELLSRAHQLVSNCACKAGCPFCVGSSDASHGTPWARARKPAALAMLRRSLDDA